MPSSKAIKAFIVILFTLFASGLILVLLLFFQLSPIDSQSKQPILFTIQSGEGVSSIATRLKEANLIKNPTTFKLAVLYLDLAKQIQAGNFYLSPSQSATEIATSLTKASADEIRVTFLEGWRREEYADQLETAFVQFNSPFNKQEFLSLTKSQEGYLFPDTYLFAKDATTPEIVSILKNTFEKKISSLSNQISSSSRSLSEIITMASIIEREARTDRSLVAGILYKRLDNDWPLQADATLQYAKGYSSRENTWWPEPLAADKDISSPFNTYLNPGLPASPIANPSLDSITAAINPTPTDYLFYITDNDGQMHYAQTLDQHNQNVQTYLR